MKKLINLITFVCLSIIAQAQPVKGNVLIGGDFNMDFAWAGEDNSVFSFNINAISAVLLNDNFAVGGGLGYGLSVLNDLGFTTSSVTVYPVIRYYFNSDVPIKFFFDLRPGVAIVSVNSDFGDDGEAAFIFRGGPGLAAFLSDDVSVDFSLNYYREPSGGFQDSFNRIGLNVGLQVFINQSKQE
jgi:hypothetical protein